jgi:hypothetical protein
MAVRMNPATTAREPSTNRATDAGVAVQDLLPRIASMTAATGI